MTSILDYKTSDSVNWLQKTPIAHRGLHNAQARIYENTLSAAQAAMEAGYSIEVDLQPSMDDVPMVFHDYELDRLTSKTGKTREMGSDLLQNIKIMDSDDAIPTLRQLLDLIQGKVGIVLELKGLVGKDDGFVAAVAKEIGAYKGDIAIMSFHHHILEDARRVAPEIGLGLTAHGENDKYDQHMLAVSNHKPDFISYELKNLDTRFVEEFTRSGKPSISWTVKSEKDAARSAQFVDQITFEGFRP